MKTVDDFINYHVILWTKNGQRCFYELRHFSLDFINDGQDYEYVLFLKFDFPANFISINLEELCHSLEQLFEVVPDMFLMLTHRKNPPLTMFRLDEQIYSFSANFGTFKRLVLEEINQPTNSQTLLFNLMDYICTSPTSYKKIIVKQIPFVWDNSKIASDVDIIIPHRGDNSFLHGLLYYLNQIDQLNIFVGLDQIPDSLCSQKLKKNLLAQFYVFHPNPVGPYVIRNELINISSADLLVFQDSDDLPCADRFNRIQGHMASTGAEMCGSHEIKLDYYSKSVHAIRYPLDVKKALAKGPGHALLHPSSAITRQAFYKCDRLSEERSFGNDTKFLYYSYFKLDNILNVDEFLYIRRLHPNSLTTSSATSIESAQRINLVSSLVRDFDLIKAGKIDLETSSLKYAGPKFAFTATKL